MWPHVALFIPFYVRISGESVKPGMITAPVIHVPENIRAYRALVTANKALVGTLYAGNVCNVETGTFFLGLFC